MATIGARGDKELARWRCTQDSPIGAPYELVLTNQGRLLEKAQARDEFTLIRHRHGSNMTFASARAEFLGMERIDA